MKKIRKFKFQQLAALALSATVLTVAQVVASAPCHLFYYQPKTPQNLKARLAKR